MSVKEYFKKNLIRGLTTQPFCNVRVLVAVVMLYSILALTIGFGEQIFQVKPLEFAKFWFLPLTLFVFPSFLEELAFRGLIIPRDSLDKGWKVAAGWIVASSLAFTLWHPLNALTINPTAKPYFLNVPFLVITFCLGLACGTSYVVSRSLWSAVLIHWLTVVVWVFVLGGRNLVIER